MRWRTRRGITANGFTLVELLVVIMVIGVLIAMLLPAAQHSRESARRTTCVSNLRQLGPGLLNHEQQFGAFPAGFRLTSPTRSVVPDLLPFVEQSNLNFNLRRDWDSSENQSAVRTSLTLMRCPSAPNPQRVDLRQPALMPAAGDYAPTHGVNPVYCQLNGWPLYDPPQVNGVLINRPCPISDIRDGTSNTILLVKDAGRPELWRMGRRATGNSYNAGWADPNYELALDGSDRLTSGSG